MTVTLTVAGIERHFLLHIPPNIVDPRTAIVMLHGAGASAAWVRDETHWNITADQYGFVVAYPEGLALNPSRPSGFLDNPQVWNAGDGPRLIVNRGPDDVAFLAAMIADLQMRAAIDPSRVFMTGFSNGAAMTFRFAAERSAGISAIAPVSGYCPHVGAMPRSVPTLFLVGSEDPLVPIAGGEVRSPWDGRIETRPPLSTSLARWAAALGLNPVLTLVRDDDGILKEQFAPDFQTVTIPGLGHHWPGGRGRLLRRLAGQPSTRVNANELIWEFFRTRV
jgi:polyhydroxybutyrate depolymerase